MGETFILRLFCSLFLGYLESKVTYIYIEISLAAWYVLYSCEIGKILEVGRLEDVAFPICLRKCVIPGCSFERPFWYVKPLLRGLKPSCVSLHAAVKIIRHHKRELNI